MKTLVLLAVGLMACSACLFAGEYLMNDTGVAVTGLRVVFSEHVRVTGFGDVLLSVEPYGESTEFVFSGGEVGSWGGHWLNWEPASAVIDSYAWLLGLELGDAADVTELVEVIPVKLEGRRTRVIEGITVYDTAVLEGVIRRTIPLRWPFSIRYEASFPGVGDLILEWLSEDQTAQGMEAVFQYPDHYTNWDSFDTVLNITDPDGRLYVFSDQGVMFRFQNGQQVSLDARDLVPEDRIAEVSWSIKHPWDEEWNKPSEFLGRFPLSGQDSYAPTLLCDYPDLVQLKCEIETTDGQLISQEGEVLFFSNGGSVFEDRAVATASYTTFCVEEFRAILEEGFPLLEKIGYNGIGTSIRERFGWPEGEPENRVFSIHPVYDELCSGYDIHDPRGTTIRPEFLDVLFEETEARGFDLHFWTRQLPYQDDLELQRQFDASGHGEQRGFAQEPGYLYSEEGLAAFFIRRLDEWREHPNAGTVFLTFEMDQLVQDGGQVMRDFFTDMYAQFQAEGIAVSTGQVYPFINAGRRDMDWTISEHAQSWWDILIDPSRSGVPYASADSIGITYYAPNATYPDEPLSSLFAASRDHVRNLSDLSETYGKPIFIADAYAFCLKDAPIHPIPEELWSSSLGYSEEDSANWLYPTLSAFYEANKTRENPLFTGMTVESYAWWTDESFTCPTCQDWRKGPYLNPVVGHELIYKVVGVFFWDGTYAAAVDMPARADPVDSQVATAGQGPVPPSPGEIAGFLNNRYEIDTTSGSQCALLMDDFEDSPSFRDSGWSIDYDSAHRQRADMDPTSYCNLSFAEDGRGNSYLVAEFEHDSWVKTRYWGESTDVSTFDGIELTLWADEAWTVSVELGTQDPIAGWQAGLISGVDVNKTPRRFRLPFSDFKNPTNRDEGIMPYLHDLVEVNVLLMRGLNRSNALEGTLFLDDICFYKG